MISPVEASARPANEPAGPMPCPGPGRTDGAAGSGRRPLGRGSALWRFVAVAALLGAVVLLAASVRQYPHRLGILDAELPAIALSIVAVLALRRAGWNGRTLAVVVLGGSVLLQIAAASAPPSTSDDSYRYVWDGTVQLAGIDPYRYTPADPALERLRDGRLFPADAAQCAGTTFDDGAACTRLNRPTVRTVYPPVAEAAFALMRVASFGGHGGQLPVQLFGAIGALAIGALLLRRDPIMSALWAWSPIAAMECTNNAHIDWLAVLLVLGSLAAGGSALARRTADPAAGAGGRGRSVATGALIGLAIAVKLYPALLLPALLIRRGGRAGWLWLVGAASAVVALSYLPHVLAVGPDVIGFLPGYLNEEGYQSGRRFGLLDIVLPQGATPVAAVALLAAAAGWTWWRVARGADPVPADVAATTLVGIAVLVAASNYPWYMLLLLALACWSGQWQWLPVVIAPSATYLLGQFSSPWVDRGVYLAAVASMAALWFGRTAARPHPNRESATTDS
jgi:hypothetical protein